MAEQIYTEEQARIMMALAFRDNRCAELLNTLADGGMVTRQLEEDGWKLVLVPGDTFSKWYDQQFPTQPPEGD